ncbi:MAG TPA: phosphate acyltransferase PlsX [Candidatus Brocadiia bacterium]|nr:phosphate acyltransferase PlsX [Candidatus Brocadiia bacterium]
MRIAVDAMGGDRAPCEVVKGTIDAAKVYPRDEFILVGDETAIKLELGAAGARKRNLRIIHAPEMVGMEESPVKALRSKQGTSIAVAIETIAKGEADAVVSAGHTGATVAAACLGLKRLKGCVRPGIAVCLPTLEDRFIVICDAGANIAAKPIHLFQYGVMARVFAANVLEVEDPSIGLLNVGTEEGKGTDLVKEAYNLLKDSSLNFIGNMEGRDIATGAADICVCEGFVGNIILKLSEGLAMSLMKTIGEECTKGPWTQLGLALSKPALRSIKDRIDFSEYGGAPLLGIDGVIIVSHGSSNAKAITSAIRESLKFVSSDVNRKIEAELAKHARHPATHAAE